MLVAQSCATLCSPIDCSPASPVAQMLKHLPAMRQTQIRSLGQKDPLEKEMATHSSTLAWKMPWTEEPGRLQSMGSQRIGHDWPTSLSFSDYSPPGSTVHGISQARILEWVAIPFSNSIQSIHYKSTILWCVCVCVLVAHLCPTLRNPMDYSLPAPLSMAFSKQEYWSGLHFLLQGIFPTQGLNWHLLYFLPWQANFTTVSPGKPQYFN